MSSNIVLSWWVAGETVKEFEEIIERGKEKWKCSPDQEFAKSKAVVTIYTSNSLEGTIPSNFSEAETGKILEALYESSDSIELRGTWLAEGSEDTLSSRRQLAQHIKAMNVLKDHAKSKLPLTSDILCHTHATLMDGAIGEDNKIVSAGVYRKHAAYSAGTAYVYSNWEQIPELVESCLTRFNGDRKGNLSEWQVCQIVARLLFTILDMHPFENGNGRLARLLVSYAFMVFGSPFAIPLVDGHLKNKKHFLKCLLWPAPTTRNDHLAAYVLNCYALAWANFLSTNVELRSDKVAEPAALY